jgi:hypothetical protein
MSLSTKARRSVVGPKLKTFWMKFNAAMKSGQSRQVIAVLEEDCDKDVFPFLFKSRQFTGYQDKWPHVLQIFQTTRCYSFSFSRLMRVIGMKQSQNASPYVVQNNSILDFILEPRKVLCAAGARWRECALEYSSMQALLPFQRYHQKRAYPVQISMFGDNFTIDLFGTDIATFSGFLSQCQRGTIIKLWQFGNYRRDVPPLFSATKVRGKENTNTFAALCWSYSKSMDIQFDISSIYNQYYLSSSLSQHLRRLLTEPSRESSILAAKKAYETSKDEIRYYRETRALIQQ